MSIVHNPITEMRCIPRHRIKIFYLHTVLVWEVIEVAKCLTVWYQSKTVSGATPLHLACRSGHAETVKYLVSEMKCNTTIQDKNDFYPVHYACFQMLPAMYATYWNKRFLVKVHKVLINMLILYSFW